jgi:type VI secretion system protein ImpM
VTATRAGAFGKLPIFADFLRHGATPRDVQAIDRWFQEGILHAAQVLGDSWASAYDATPPRRFLLRAPDAERTLAGIAVPGVDSVGRRYPFTVFRILEGTPWEEEWPSMPLAVEEFLGEASRLAVRGWSALDPRQLGARVDGLPAASAGDSAGLRRLRDERLGSIAYAEFSGNLSGPGEASAMGRILRNVKMAVAAPPGRGSRPCLKLPLPSGIEPSAAVAFWLDAVRRCLSRRARPSLVFWHEGAPGSLFLADPAARVFLSWIDPGRAGDHIWDLGTGGWGGDEPAPPGTDRSLLEVLESAMPERGR